MNSIEAIDSADETELYEAMDWLLPRQAAIEQAALAKRQLSDEVFLSKAPQKVVDTIRAKLADYETQLAKLS